MREPSLKTRISVPTDDVEPLMDALSDAGFLVLDSGERITTAGGLEGEATLELVEVPSEKGASEADDAVERRDVA
jgi:hypothetical protein